MTLSIAAPTGKRKKQARVTRPRSKHECSRGGPDLTPKARTPFHAARPICAGGIQKSSRGLEPLGAVPVATFHQDGATPVPGTI